MQAKSKFKVLVYGIHKLMLMRPKSQYLKDRHTHSKSNTLFRKHVTL